MQESPPVAKLSPTLVRLRYGVNETDSWWHFAQGQARDRIQERLRELRTEIVRVFLYDKNAPDPLTEWPLLRSYLNAVLAVGAVPMVTFAKFDRPVDDPRAVRWFAERCGDVVWHCLEEWGEERVRDWYWCVWNEPNSTWIGGGLEFEQYRDIYENVAAAMLRWLGPALRGRRLRIGGPAVEGFQPFWMDWVWRFLTEIDQSLLGFVNWHLYADWREHGENGAPLDPATHQAIMLWQAREYERRALLVSRLLWQPGILNMCGEWNAHSHYLPHVRARFNQTRFGAAYGGLALLNLIRGGVDAEMLWTGTDDGCGYGVLDADAVPTPLFYARRLFAQYIRRGDRIITPKIPTDTTDLDGMIVAGDDTRRSAVLVHREPREATYDIAELTCGEFDGHCMLIKVDGGTGNGVVVQRTDGKIGIAGYGVAVVSNAVAGCDVAVCRDWA
jgi:hypothetical protein